ncbi:YDG domain-containing protein, partial [Escherichia coli]
TGHFTASSKVYDGNASATITGRSVTGQVAGDDVDLAGGTATFGSKNVGTGKTVTGTGFALTGVDAGNYSLASSTLSTT